MLVLTGIIVTLGVGWNYALNPYGAWRIALLPSVFRTVQHERMVDPYLLRSARPSTILLGTSRVYMGMPIDQGERSGVMNAALTAATIPQLGALTELALRTGPPRRIVWGVDFFTFDSKWNHVDADFDRRVAGNLPLKIGDTLLSLDALRDSDKMVGRARAGISRLPSTMTAPIPWPDAMICAQFRIPTKKGLENSSSTEVRNELLQDLPDYSTYQFSPDLFARFSSTIGKARAQGIEVDLFIPAMSQYELELIRQAGQWQNFQNFKRKLVKVAPFWDFSGYNQIARTDSMFMHIMHFKVPVGMEILRIVFGMDAPRCAGPATVVAQSAQHIDAENIEAALAMQDRLMTEAAAHESRYSRAVAESPIGRERPARDLSASK